MLGIAGVRPVVLQVVPDAKRELNAPHREHLANGGARLPQPAFIAMAVSRSPVGRIRRRISPFCVPDFETFSKGPTSPFAQFPDLRPNLFRSSLRIRMHRDRAQPRGQIGIDGPPEKLQIDPRHSSAHHLRRRIGPVDRRHRLAQQSRYSRALGSGGQNCAISGSFQISYRTSRPLNRIAAASAKRPKAAMSSPVRGTLPP